MYYGTIKNFDVADGPGCRVSLFVSGCRNHCPGCFNRETWDFGYGREYTGETEKDILQALAPDYIQGLSLLGGDPFEPENQRELLHLLRNVKAAFPKKDIWAYTGYVYDTDLVPGGKKYTPAAVRMLSCMDVLVDGPFVQAQKNISLQFRGSSNQRVLDMPRTLAEGAPVWAEGYR